MILSRIWPVHANILWEVLFEIFKPRGTRNLSGLKYLRDFNNTLALKISNFLNNSTMNNKI